MSTNLSTPTSRTSSRGRRGRVLAAGAIVLISLAPATAFANGIGDKVDAQPQKIHTICEVVPRLPYLCLGG